MIRGPLLPRVALSIAVALCACKSDDDDDDDRDDPPAAAPETSPAPADLASEPAVAPSGTAGAGDVALPEPPALSDRPLGLPEAPSPPHNPTTAAKVALGKLLFFDPRLSLDGSMSCSSCHDPALGWADGKALSMTVAAALNQRHVPTLLNVVYHEELYWDGRMPTLEALVLSNWKGQMGARPAEVAARLDTMPVYRAHFQRAFRDDASPARIAEALASFVRTVRSGDTPWDRYEAGDAAAVSADAIAGARVFNDRAGCALCHSPPLYTDLGYHDIGLPRSKLSPDPGRFRVTGNERDRGAFKTPGLRGLGRSAPFFHNGSAPTLDAVLDYKLAELPTRLSKTERRQLEAFLAALNDPEAPTLEPPALPAEPPPPGPEAGDAGLDGGR